LNVDCSSDWIISCYYLEGLTSDLPILPFN
jgi:hypothetical protein